MSAYLFSAARGHLGRSGFVRNQRAGVLNPPGKSLLLRPGRPRAVNTYVSGGPGMATDKRRSQTAATVLNVVFNKLLKLISGDDGG